jgi:hypothetical protein
VGIRCCSSAADDTDSEPIPVDSNPCASLLGASPVSGDVAVSSPEELAAIAGVTSISGDLAIRETPFVDLAGLESLVCIGGNLRIEGNPNLVGVEGLDALGTIAGTLEITSNGAFASLDGFADVEEIRWFYAISLTDNPSLPCCELCDLLALAPDALDEEAAASMVGASILNLPQGCGMDGCVDMDLISLVCPAP